MASINDVAKLAGVSKSTVSLVINDTGYVSNETRVKVESAIEKLNYIPSKLAQNFSRQNSGIIAVVVPDIEHPFFATLIKYIEKKLSKKQYMTMVCSAKGGEDTERRFVDMLNRKMVDGIIMAGHTIDIEEYRKSSRPIVSIDRYINDEIPILHSDYVQAATLACDKLVSAGCKCVIQFVGTKKVAIQSDNFNQICVKLLEEKGVRVELLHLRHNSFTVEEYETAAKRLFMEYPDVDGIIGVDLSVLACMQEIQRRNLSVPKDIKVLAYDGTYITRSNTPVITSIVQSVDKMGEKAAELVLALIDGEKLNEKNIVFPVHLQEGDSV